MNLMVLSIYTFDHSIEHGFWEGKVSQICNILG